MRMGQRIKLQRTKKGWSQCDLAREAGVPQPTVSRIESGTMEEMQVGIGMARRFARALGSVSITLAATFEDEEDPVPGQPPQHDPEPCSALPRHKNGRFCPRRA